MVRRPPRADGGRAMKKRWPGFLLFAVLLAAWEVSSAWKLIDPVSVPRVSLIMASWIDTLRNGQMINALLPSLWRIFAGFGLAVLVAVPLGLLRARSHCSIGCWSRSPNSSGRFRRRPTFRSPSCSSASATR